ncbi:MAG: restriction endonuclease [Patescibacteria group bacterium]
MADIFITKASGEKVPFNENKVLGSIKRAGISPELFDQVLSHVKSILYDGITTREIHDHIVEFLGPRGLKYSLKKAIMELGPSGYPFEKFIAEILCHQGYETITGQIVKGRCVSHEIDVIAQKDKEKIMIECKFHNLPGTRVDVKVALYVKGRFEDVQGEFTQGWLITNTKFTTDAIDYAKCSGLKLIGWGYPETDNLQYWVENSNLYPVTILTTLSPNQKQQLLSQNIVLCKDLAAQKNLPDNVRQELLLLCPH